MAREPCGEDIADTETDLSENSDEDEYENSFIDDDEPEVYPSSPISNDESMLRKHFLRFIFFLMSFSYTMLKFSL